MYYLAIHLSGWGDANSYVNNMHGVQCIIQQYIFFRSTPISRESSFLATEVSARNSGGNDNAPQTFYMATFC